MKVLLSKLAREILGTPDSKIQLREVLNQGGSVISHLDKNIKVSLSLNRPLKQGINHD